MVHLAKIVAGAAGAYRINFCKKRNQQTIESLRDLEGFFVEQGFDWKATN